MRRRGFDTVAVTSAAAGALIAQLGLAGCAATNSETTASLLTPVAASSTANGAPKSVNYVLSDKEKDMECKQLTGRMQIRILEIRDYNERTQTSNLARALQSGVSSVAGGTQHGTDPSGAYAKDRAMLDAYNAQLLAKGCKAFDLESQLTPQDVRVTPTATIKPAGKPATAPKTN